MSAEALVNCLLSLVFNELVRLSMRSGPSITQGRVAVDAVASRAAWHLIEILKCTAELHHLSPHNGVLGLHGRVASPSDAQECEHSAVLLLQLVHLCN